MSRVCNVLAFVTCRKLLACSTAVLFAQLALASDPWAKFASGPGSIAYVGIGWALPALRDGKAQFLRTTEALGATLAITEALKSATHVKRPDSSSHDSFPSGHASAAFAIATMESSFHPKEAPLWYAGAALIAESRLVLRRHRIADVTAGAALGFLTSRAELSSRHGWVITPLLGPGVAISARF